MRYWFGLSLTFNLLMLTTIVAARVDATRESAPVSLRSDQSLQFGGLPVQRDAIAGVGDLAEVLEGTGLASRDIKTLLLAWLIARYGDASEPVRTPFWNSGYRPGLNDFQRRVEVEKQARDSLIEYFGGDAANNPAFDSVFRPLGTDYAFLSSRAQLELQSRQLEVLESHDRAGSPDRNLAGCTAVAISPERAQPPMPPTTIGEDEQHEYRLRFSAVSQDLRDSVTIDDEQSFRSIFERVSQLDENSSPRAQAEIRAELRSRMGDLAFDRFWSGRDPLFGPVENYLRGKNLSPQQILEAYSIINRAQERLLIALAHNPNQQSMLSSVQQARTDEEADLTRLLGAEIAAGLAGTMMRAAISLSNASMAGC